MNLVVQYWFYFLARFKIFKHYNSELSYTNNVYLKRYFLLIFKVLLRQDCYAKAYRVWKMALISDKSYTFKQHMLLLLSLLSYFIFKKGDIFLTKVNRWDI